MLLRLCDFIMLIIFLVQRYKTSERCRKWLCCPSYPAHWKHFSIFYLYRYFLYIFYLLDIIEQQINKKIFFCLSHNQWITTRQNIFTESSVIKIYLKKIHSSIKTMNSFKHRTCVSGTSGMSSNLLVGISRGISRTW